MVTPTVSAKNRPAWQRIMRENASPSTPSIRKPRLPLPGPSPLSLKRSASFANSSSSSERPRKRRTRSSDIVFQKRVSTLLEQAQSVYKSDDESTSPQTDPVSYEDTTTELFEDLDLDLLEAEFKFDPISSDGLQKVVAELPNITLQSEMHSDDLFDNDFDNLNPEELEALDISSTVPIAAPPSTTEQSPDEDAMLFGDGYEELMDLDFDGTQSEV